jgi:hypothetical protein
VLVALVAGAIALIEMPFGLAAIRLGPLSILWWYAALVAPGLAAATTVAIIGAGGPDMAPRPPALGAPRETRGARLIEPGGPDMAPRPPMLGAPRETRGAPRIPDSGIP